MYALFTYTQYGELECKQMSKLMLESIEIPVRPGVAWRGVAWRGAPDAGRRTGVSAEGPLHQGDGV